MRRLLPLAALLLLSNAPQRPVPVPDASHRLLRYLLLPSPSGEGAEVGRTTQAPRPDWTPHPNPSPEGEGLRATQVVPGVSAPAYVQADANVVEYTSRSAIARLARRWADPSVRVVVAHFGDSHVQKGTITEAERAVLEADRGYGGRGMVFPYAIAKTYSQNDLDSSFTGTWRQGNSIQQPPRIPVGIAGFAAETTDADATVTLSFTTPLDPGAKRVRVFYSVTGAPYRLTMTTSASADAPTASSRFDQASSVADFRFAQVGSTLTLAVHTDQPGAGAFTLRGVDVENAPATGVLVHNLGVGGAVYQALLQQTWFEPEMKAIAPDLVILDWGTNDLLFTHAPSPAFSDVVRRTIARVRRAAPDAAILLTTPQSMAYKGRELNDTPAMADSLRALAAENDCLFWDWFHIAGGTGAVARWSADGLQGKDGIHLTGRGYRLKGTMLAQALLGTIAYARAHPGVGALGSPVVAR